eukprot:CAMPEP_0195271814 /NCGR_PEP_ID=MMETSP0706-20130129/15337_1 /TAXON_ID=33640 /ORGANISM="Asterionellopsis glacialis, Strain CCMP134" /LENGTH=46 /DNA_ID= /DNA_START= /DNA_END= /DNA_ORIENTATION=
MNEKTIQADTLDSASDLSEDQNDDGDSPDGSIQSHAKRKSTLGVWH